MRKTSNIELSLYDPTDTFDITGSSNSLNHNMEIIDQKFSDTPNSSDIEKVNKDIASLKEGTNSLKEDLSNKLPKSPKNWEQWTDEEQAVARERMSAEKALSGNVVFDETITESIAIMNIPVPGGWNNILLRVLYPKSGDEYAGNVNTGNIYATAGKTNAPYDLYVLGDNMKTPSYPDRRLFFNINLIKRGIYAELNRYIAGATGEQTGWLYAVLSSQCAYSDVEAIRFACEHIPAGTQFTLYVD